MQSRRNVVIGGLQAGGVMLIAAVITLWLRQLPWRADFSKWPPAGVFQMVLGQPPPSGVTTIRVAGRQYFTHRWVWMRFQANAAAMKSLSGLGTSLSGPDTRKLVDSQWSSVSRYDHVDQQMVAWPRAAALAGLPALEFYQGSPGIWQWHGVLFEDHHSHTVYVESEGS